MAQGLHGIEPRRAPAREQGRSQRQGDAKAGDLHAVAADWESGAIAWTAKRNGTRVLVLRAVSDLVSQVEGEIYDSDGFADAAREAMLPMLKALPNWVRCIYWGQAS